LSLKEFLFTFTLGSLVYGIIEVLYRGWTHWAMLICGGLCFYLVYIISSRSRDRRWKKWVMCASVITTVEFLFGIIFNIYLNEHIWDYSHQNINLMGQICLTYSMYWLFLSIPGVKLCEIISHKLFRK